MRSRRGEKTSNNSSNTKKISKREFFQNLREGIPKYLYSRQGSLGDQATNLPLCVDHFSLLISLHIHATWWDPERKKEAR